MERKRYNVRQSVHYVNKNMGLVTGIGTVFAITLMIPWLSIIVCCFVSLLSVIAATVALDRLEKQDVQKPEWLKVKPKIRVVMLKQIILFIFLLEIGGVYGRQKVARLLSIKSI